MTARAGDVPTTPAGVANLHPMTQGKKEILDVRAVAKRCGLKYSTVLGYHGLATARRKEGASRPGDLPEPDDRIGGSPVWYPETIDRWQKTRPGQGKFGGPKRKDSKGS